MKEQKTWEELIKLVKNWGQERHIDNDIMQFAKMNEEMGEIAHELTRSHIGKGITPNDEGKDAIGDTLVTLIIFSDIVGIDPREALECAWEAIKDRTGHTENGSFVKNQ